MTTFELEGAAIKRAIQLHVYKESFAQLSMDSEDAAVPVLSKPQAEQIVQLSYTTFRELEPWYRAECEHPQARALIFDIRNEVANICRTLHRTLIAAKEACLFADEASYSFGHIASANEIDPLLIEGQLTAAREQAQSIRNRFEDILSRYKSHRQAISESSRRLKTTLETIVEERTTQEKERNASESVINIVSKALFAARLISYFFGDPSTTGKIGISSAVILPTFLAINGYGHYYVDRARVGIAKRSTVIRECNEAVHQLDSGSAGLEQLATLLASVSSWWSRIDTEFEMALVRIDREQTNRNLKYFSGSLEQKFKRITDFFLEYKVALDTMESYFPEDLDFVTDEDGAAQAE